MYAVAIAELSERGGDATALAQLATELGTTLYELKLVLNAGLPAIVSLTVDAAVASNASAAIARHGHRAVRFDRRSLVPSTAMTTILDVRFEPDALRAGNRQDERLAYADILALLRATLRSQETGKREEKERKFRPGMAIATGGLVLSKTTKREVVTHTETREQVLYLFSRSGGTPWILRERTARYAGLGSDLAPSALENFRTTVQRLRQRAPGAVYDERLLNPRPVRGIADGVAATDLLAHLIVADLRQTAFP
jgi:hypothetical protein